MSDADILDLRRRVAAIEQHLGLTPGAAAAGSPASDPELQRLVRDGKTIQAIKRYRELTGAGLAEAKDAVEALPRV